MPGFTEQLNHSVVSLQHSFHLFFELWTVLCDPTELVSNFVIPSLVIKVRTSWHCLWTFLKFFHFLKYWSMCLSHVNTHFFIYHLMKPLAGKYQVKLQMSVLLYEIFVKQTIITPPHFLLIPLLDYCHQPLDSWRF